MCGISRVWATYVTPDLVWRQQSVELSVQCAVRLQNEGRHLLLCGDPVTAVEVVAAPSALRLHGVAFCVLDAAPEAQEAQLAERGDDPPLLVHHQAFAAWMRAQAADPQHMLNVVTEHGWTEVRWDRVPQTAEDWRVHVVDTTYLTPPDTAAAVLAWIKSAIASDETA